ncbi:amidohydrolase [Lachnospiraceae bacterium C1.1]|nr:amidohydrolase [Lachnospiraceae bacterium C1.1]
MGIVIKDALTVLCENGIDKIAKHSIYIDGENIVGIDQKPEGFTEDTVIDGKDRFVIPGLINAHTHTYMSMMRNCADDLSFMDWLFKTVNPIEDRLEGDDAYWGSLLGQIEMIKSGTTCFNDQQMNIHKTTRAVKESGMRATICRGLVGDKYDKSDKRLNEALEEMEDGKDCDRLGFFFGPHAPYTCSPEYLKMCADVAKEKGYGIHIHLSESATESENMMKDHNCTPIEYARDAGVFEVPTIAAHCVQVTPSDIEILKKYNVSVVTNPASNMKLGNGFAPIPEMMAAGVNVCLGTDGAASNNGQNMFREMSFLSLIHKGTHKTPQCISARETFAIATRNGAQALGLADKTGTIEVGKKADLAILRLDVPSMMPNNNLLAALCYSANGSETDTVIINGRIVMQNREIKTVDEERVYYEIRKICSRLGLDKKEY